LSAVVKTHKQCMCPLFEDCLKKLSCIPTMGCNRLGLESAPSPLTWTRGQLCCYAVNRKQRLQ
jgi:hypothetical protein